MLDWRYQPACDLQDPLLERLHRFPREPDLLCYGLRSLTAIGIRTWLRTYHRLQIEGRENLPANGSFVLVSNHSSHLDALCLLAALPLSRLHHAFPAAAADYFFISRPRTALAVLLVNALPFHRKVHIRQTLAMCRSLLTGSQNILILFPEGTRSPDGILGAFKPGIGMLLAGSPVPVVPCYLQGASAALPKGSWLPRPRPLRLKIGKPRCYAACAHDKHSVSEICIDLRHAIQQVGAIEANDPQKPCTFAA